MTNVLWRVDKDLRSDIIEAIALAVNSNRDIQDGHIVDTLLSLVADTDSVLAEVQTVIDEYVDGPIDFRDDDGPDNEMIDERSHYEIGIACRYPPCCCRAFDGGFHWMDAAIEFFRVHGMLKKQSDEAIKQIGHIPCPECIARWRARRDSGLWCTHERQAALWCMDRELWPTRPDSCDKA